MGYSWYRTDSAYHRHPKTLALKAELKQPLADAYVSRLWSWTQVYAQDGRFPVALVPALESELGWTDSAGSLAAALEKCGFLDRHGDEFEVHDWPDYQGYLVKKAKRDADKKRKRRSRSGAAPSARTTRGQSGDKVATAPPTDVTDGRNERTDGTNGTAPEKAPAPDDLGQAWNSDTAAPLPRVTLPLDGERKKAATAALTRRPLPAWHQVFKRIQASSFCRGQSDSGWLATFDWAVRPAGKKPEPATSVLEGAYDRQSTGPPGSATAPPTTYGEGYVT